MAQPPPTFHLSDFENLQEDLVLLQTSLEQDRVQPERAREQCADILGAVAELTTEQQLDAYAAFVGRLVQFVSDAGDPHRAMGVDFWALTLDVLDELLAALEMGDAGLKVDADAMHLHIEAFDGRLHGLSSGEAPPAETATPEEGQGNGEVEEASDVGPVTAAAAPSKTEAPSDATGDDDELGPQSLLERAAQAAAAGRHEEAQELATAAASGLALKARNRKHAELLELRDKLTVIQSEMDSLEGELGEARQELGQRAQQMEAAQGKVQQAATHLEETSATMDDVKGKLEEIERRMAKLQAAQTKLMATFEEALPGKEAAHQAHEAATERLEEAATGGAVMQARIQEVEESLTEMTARKTGLEEKIAALEIEIGE